MKISIVTISFNQKKYLHQCIESILTQTGCELEYIVVDPGSTDGSRELIESYGDQIIKVFEPDDGPADGLIKGFRRATGEIFGFINSDDYLLPNALEPVATFFDKQGLQCFVTGQGYVEYASGLKQKIYPTPLTRQSMLYRSAVIFQQATFFPANLYRQVGGFNPKNSTCWDYELFLRFLLLNSRHEVISAQIAAFRIHEESISGSGRLTQRYLLDLDRLFLEVVGRDRNLSDRCQTFFLRVRQALTSRLREF